MLTFSTQFWRMYQWYRAAGGQGIWDQHGLALVWSDSTGRPQPPASGTHIHQPSDDQQRKVTLYHSQIVWRLWIFSSHNYIYMSVCGIFYCYIAHCPCTAFMPEKVLFESHVTWLKVPLNVAHILCRSVCNWDQKFNQAIKAHFKTWPR